MITAAHFSRLLAAVLPHVSTDESMTTLTNIRLEVTDSDLLAVATDRYTLAIARHQLVAPAAPLSFDIHRSDAHAYIDHLLADPSAPVSFDRRDGDLVLRIGEEWFEPAPRWIAGSAFPDWRALLADTLNARREPVTEMSLNPRFLARLAAVRSSATTADIRFAGACKPLLVRIDDWFLALVMPAGDAASEVRAHRVETLAHGLLTTAKATR